MKEKTVGVRCSEEDKELYIKLAEKNGYKNLSSYITSLLKRELIKNFEESKN